MGLVEGHSTEGVGKILSGFSMVFPMGFSYDIYIYIYILYRKNHRKTHGIAIFPTVFAIFFSRENQSNGKFIILSNCIQGFNTVLSNLIIF